ncbi:transposase [Colletotrichum chrysophilum]|uniref:Transposase n=1 Tax=Colletotrichum chrysophilum TaxID=1836956 RepID=A0AAD8ZY43_9PEZI|nr:transposase [Colletotrichum chrysophilum]
MWECYTNNVHLLFLPPHTSHVLQPLDQSVFSPVKAAYRKELSYLTQWNDSTIIGKRNFISCYQEARLAGLTETNKEWLEIHWVVACCCCKATNELPTTTQGIIASLAPSTPLNKKAKGAYGAQNAHDNEELVSASSAVKWSTPRKMKDLGNQLHLYSQLEQSIATQRQLFRKVKKGFQEQSMELATARHQIQLLQAQASKSITRKRKAVHIDPNTKFATISDVRQAQIEAGDVADDTDESSASDYSLVQMSLPLSAQTINL